MTELTISPEEIRSAISSYVSSLETGTSREEVGTVADTGDGIAHVEGLPSAMTNELLEFPGGVLGVALNLDVHLIGAVILGDYANIEEGQQVKRTGEILSVPVGDGFLGRVVDPLGNPIDGLGDIEAEERRVLELQAASVMQRQSVGEPLQTGIKAIDAMTPIGRGQRQLIIGDRKTGKSAVCIDTIINQKQNWATGDPKQQVRCIYVAIGQKGSTIAGIRASLEEAGALEYTTIVASPASDPAGFKWIAPYTGSALGQHWMYQGNHVLIVFDDLSKQAEAYRAISLLLRRPPGREAYPGDVFYLHSRLLERCAKLSDELGAGSMTGLPIIETKANDVSAYIPTNVISITDGQVFLESDLFNQGVRPAINVGISVSRVGGAAQIKAMKQVSGSLRLDLSQYRELEAFAAFGSDLDAASAAALGRGERLVELLKQSQYSPFPVAEEVVSIWLGTSGQLDKVPVGDIRRFETEFLDHLRRNENGILDEIRDTGKLPDETIERLEGVVRDFMGRFTTSDGSTIAPKDEPVDAMDEDDEDRESVKVNRPAPSGGGSGGSNGAAAEGSDGASDRSSHGGSDGGSPSGSSTA
jgi:F-type H+/Na+-transporting ATPase subunit alpha